MLTWVVQQVPPEKRTVRVGKDSKGNSSLDGVHDGVEMSVLTEQGAWEQVQLTFAISALVASPPPPKAKDKL